MNTANTLPEASGMTYAEALSELEKIVRDLQSDATNVDVMVAKTRRAAELLKACRAKLTTTEKELQDVLATLQNEN